MTVDLWFRNEHISHAILDVFKAEPLSPDSRLWDHPHVTITPHVSAESFDWQVSVQSPDNFMKKRLV